MPFDEAALIAVVCDVLGLAPEEVKPELAMESCEAWDSLAHLNLVLALEEAFAVRFGSEIVPELHDLSAIRRALGELCSTPEPQPAREIERPWDALQPGPAELATTAPATAAADRSLAPEPDALASDAVTALPSEAKLALYRAAGARIGAGVRLEPGSRLLARRLVIGDGVRVGRGSTLRAHELDLAAGVQIGADCDWQGHTIRVGVGTRIGDRVRVDVSGGGLTRRARLEIGSRCSITSECVLNLARPVLLEDEVALSPRAMLFSHGYWPSVLEGYTARFGPLHLERGAWVGASVTVLPGCRLGAGSLVMANSCVAADVPPRTLVAGVPARPVQSGLGRPLDPAAAERRVREILAEFRLYLEARDCQVREAGEDAWWVRLPDGAEERLVFGASCGDAVCVGFGLAEAGAPTLDLRSARASGPETLLSLELRNFLRRYGIRLAPDPWHYDPGAGLGKFE